MVDDYKNYFPDFIEGMTLKIKGFLVTSLYLLTIHTNIPYNKFKHIKKLVSFIFKKGGKTFMVGDRFSSKLIGDYKNTHFIFWDK